MASLDSNRGAKRAREARDELGLGQDGPLEDVLRVVEEVGGAHVLVLELPDDVAGAYIKRPGMPLLFVCGTDFPGRQRFTLAHEFGHFRMNHEAVVDRQEDIGTWGGDPRERQANAFAAEFLVPKQALQAWDRARAWRQKVTLEDVVTLACEYGVSAIMMRYRLETCGVLRDERLATQLDAEIAADEHLAAVERLGLCHPQDEIDHAKEHLPRIPEPVGRSQLGDLLTGRTDVASAAASVGQSEEQLRAMLESTKLDKLLPPERRSAA